MARISVLIIIMLVAIGAVLWAVQSPDEILFQGPGDIEGSTSRASLALIVIVLGAVMAVLWWLLIWLWDLPGRVTRTARRIQSRRARESIAEGLLAIEGGDAAAASRIASSLLKARSDGLGTRRLALLLHARAHEGGEDWLEAERAWSDLTREKGGELAGLRGLAAAAVKRGDHRMAILHAHNALRLRTPASWPFSLLFDLQTRTGDWMGAAETLAEGEKRGLIGAEIARRRRAVLLTAEAARKRSEDPAEAERLALEAQKAAPAFPAAGLLAARLALAAGRTAKAQAALETAWKARPHPVLAIAWGDLKPGEDQRTRARRLRQLADLNPEQRESRILLAEAAIQEGDWLNASEVLAPLMEASLSGRLCALMEAVSIGQGHREDAHRWAKLAVSAPREGDWSDIDPEGRAFEFSVADWARQVAAFGDHMQLLHPRHETFARELEALSRLALPAPAVEPPARPRGGGAPSGGRRRLTSGPQDPPVRPLRPPAPDYAPED
jgi:HemY protein